jgi:hypothetical protein
LGFISGRRVELIISLGGKDQVKHESEDVSEEYKEEIIDDEDELGDEEGNEEIIDNEDNSEHIPEDDNEEEINDDDDESDILIQMYDGEFGAKKEVKVTLEGKGEFGDLTEKEITLLLFLIPAVNEFDEEEELEILREYLTGTREWSEG